MTRTKAAGVCALPQIPAWEGQPSLQRKTDDSAAIYVLRGVPGSDGRFDALRLDLNSGARSSARIAIGPATDFQHFDQAQNAESAVIQLHGLLMRRPTPFLVKIPGPGGLAPQLLDSAIGVLNLDTLR